MNKIPSNIEAFVVKHNASVYEALKQIDSNNKRFLVVVDDDILLRGVITDGDIRRFILKNKNFDESVSKMMHREVKAVYYTEGFSSVIDMFKDNKIDFLPILDKDGKVVNIITKKQMHSLLLQDISVDLNYNFFSINESLIDHEIYARPWGFFKTTVFNEYYQVKTISVKPNCKLSLQSHEHREEYWIVVRGNGVAQIGESRKELSCGVFVFIPKQCKHRMINTSEEDNLIVTEIQIGDYLGEDDIIRYDDEYGRIVRCTNE